MAFPNKKEIESVLKKLEKTQGTLMLPENPTALEQFRWDICQKFIKFKYKNKLTHEQMGEIMEVDKGKVSKILRHRINEFSTDRLISYLQKLKPNTKLKVS